MTPVAGGVVGVTGATGQLGAAWLRRLRQVQPGVRVVALVRNPEQAEAAVGDGSGLVEWVAADLAAQGGLEQAARAAAPVDLGWWHFAAATTLARSPAAEQETWAVNVEGTRRLLELVRAVNPTVPFYHISTAFVAGRQRGRIFESPPAGATEFHNPYERSKAAAERLVQAHFASGGCGLILRPSIVIAPSTSERPQLPDLCRRAVLQAMRRGEATLTLRLPATACVDLVPCDWVVDVAHALRQAEPDGRIFHLTAVEPTPVAAMLDCVAQTAPGLIVRCAPDTPVPELSPVSRYLDRILEEVREYFTAGRTFDRTQLVAAVPRRLREAPPLWDELLGVPMDELTATLAAGGG